MLITGISLQIFVNLKLNDSIVFKGFGDNTGQWIEYELKNANIEVMQVDA